MAMKEYNHNYMAIPRFERPFTVAGTYTRTNYSDRNGVIDNWYGIELIGDAEISNIVYRDVDIDWSVVTFDTEKVLYGNIESFTLVSGQVKVSVH